MEEYDDWPVPPSRETFDSRWYRPRAVLDVIAPLLGGDETAVTEVMRRARVGRFHAAGEPQNDPDIESVHPRMWPTTDDAKSVDSLLWRAGGATFRLKDAGGFDATTVEYFNIRFDPDGLAAMLRALSGEPETHALTPSDRAGEAVSVALQNLKDSIVGRPVRAMVAAGAPEQAQQEKRPISEATLQAWWQMCLTIKGAASWTGPEMREFFEQCFPDKFASRERLRELRGKQPAGPKQRAAE